MMRFLCDVHIPISISKRLSQEGFDSSHVDRLPARWHTSDKEIARIADDDRILITKDVDFRNSSVINGTPRKLIKVNLGNIPPQVLSVLIVSNLSRLEQLNERDRFLVEVDLDRLSVIEL